MGEPEVCTEIEIQGGDELNAAKARAIVRLHKSGFRIWAIARELGISVSSVAVVLAKSGIHRVSIDTQMKKGK